MTQKIAQIAKDFNIKAKDVLDLFKDTPVSKSTGGSLEDAELDLFLDLLTRANQLENLDDYVEGRAKIVVASAASKKKEEKPAEAPKAEAPKDEAPKAEAPKPAAKPEAPKAEAPKPETPKAEAPKPAARPEAPKAEAPRPAPAPQQRPTIAAAQSPAAVVSPFTCLRLVTIIVPAPIKPIPAITWALSLRGSEINGPLPIELSVRRYCPVNEVDAAPMQTRICVRNPAGRCLCSRSRPIIPPQRTASTYLRTIEISFNSRSSRLFINS